MNSMVFANKAGYTDVDSLILFGILHCAGSPKDKTEVLYGVLQDGGQEKHKHITAGDKDMVPTLTKLILSSTVHVIQLMQELDSKQGVDLGLTRPIAD